MTAVNITAEGLFEACAAGDVMSLQKLLQEPVHIAKALETEERVHDEELQLTRSSLNLALMFDKAAGAGSSEVIKYLLSFAESHGVSHQKLIRRNSICAAISSSNGVAVFKEMHAVEPDLVNTNMGLLGTPLSQAVSGSRNAPRYTADRIDLVRYLLENSADPNQMHDPDHDRPGTILRTAVQRSSLEVIKLLIQHGAQMEQSGAMHKAAENGRIDVMDLLLKQGADVNEQLWTNLTYSAASRTRMKKEQGITSDVSDSRRPEWSHETPLHYSVLSRQLEATSWLISHGANAEIADSKGWSAMEIATTMGDTNIVEAVSTSKKSI